MNTNLVTNINADSTETVTAVAAQNFAFAQELKMATSLGRSLLMSTAMEANEFNPKLVQEGLFSFQRTEYRFAFLAIDFLLFWYAIVLRLA